MLCLDAEETAEAYFLKRLEPEKARAFLDHIAACPRCARISAQTKDYIDAMRAAAKKFRLEN